MIEIKITAETAEELRNQLITLIGENKVTLMSAAEAKEFNRELMSEGVAVFPPAEKTPATRTRAQRPADAKVEKLPLQDYTIGAADDSSETPAPVSNDLLDSPAATPASNGQASLLDTPATTAEETNPQDSARKPGEIITLNDVRNKIAKAVIAGTITKPKVTDFLANYETSKGQPCTIPSDIQEKDMALVYNAIDFI